VGAVDLARRADYLEELITVAEPSRARTIARLEYQMINAVFAALQYGRSDLLAMSCPDWRWPPVR
jgi:hypothetical protein